METKAEKSQVIAQKETIDRLTRTVERLERELEKCLNPGGETKAVKPIKIERRLISERLYNVIHAAFIETRCEYNNTTQKWDFLYLPWWYFRSDLFNMDVFKNHWASPDFRTGVSMLNDICQATEGFKADVKHLDHFEMAYRLFYSNDDDSLQRGLQQLISALTTIIEQWDDTRNDIGKDDAISMLSVLKVVEFCQALWKDACEETVTEKKENA